MSEDLDKMAIDYHRWPTPGKLSVTPTTRLANQRDLSLAYSPGVAAACQLIVDDPKEAATMTARANLVAVITNGTAVLGMGSIGPLASKPVMEGKAVLFKKFAGIDVFDIEVDEQDPDKLVDIVCALEPTFGGINLEDIGAPTCFIVEQKCRERMNIPVFHDDQHGTAICVGAAVYNALRLVDKDIADVKICANGAGAAGLACLDLLVSLGAQQENITVCDRTGVIYTGRQEGMDEYKARYARDTDRRTLADAVNGADVFLGVSAGGALKPEMVKTMAERPLILALANPTPEIMPELAKAARPDAIIATGRSDYPNQVNNVLCFPFLFRGALDVGATTINEEMKLAAVRAIGDLAMAEASDVVASAYGDQALSFGPEYIIPTPFDPRLILSVAPAVAEAAMQSGVATRPIGDMAAYRQQLAQHVYRTGFAMKPLFDRAKDDAKRVVYAEGEEDRVLRAVQIAVDDGLVKPVLVGRDAVIRKAIGGLGLRLRVGTDVHVVDPQNNEHFEAYAADYHHIAGRSGVSPEFARTIMRTRATLVAAMMVRQGHADALICGTEGRFDIHFNLIMEAIGLAEGVTDASALQLLILDNASVFICDTAVTYEPTADQVAEMTLLAAQVMLRFGIEPKVALLSHSDFGTHDNASARKMRHARQIIRRLAPDLEMDGEMRADTALADPIRERLLPDSELDGAANLLVMPSLDAANIAFNLARALGNGIAVGPMLIGTAMPAHVVTPSVTVRGLVNMTAVAVADAQAHAAGEGPVAPLL